jgi:hypothetical protein
LKYFFEDGKNTDLQICVKASSIALLEASKDETIGILRNIRNCKP